MRSVTDEVVVPNLPPTHPGEFLAEDLAEIEMSVEQFADALNVPTATIEAVLQCRAPLTAELALRVAARDRGEVIAKEVQPRAAQAA
jgi:addiction module HigA family antidote